MNINKTYKLLIFSLTAFCVMLLSSCDSSRVFDDYKNIEEGQWDRELIINFDVDIQDSISRHNLYINIRNSGDCPTSNLWLFVKTIAPDSTILVDTIECILSDMSGKRYGSGIGDIYDLRVDFKRDIIFPIKGKYKFELEQGMREAIIPGITDVGIRIETASENIE